MTSTRRTPRGVVEAHRAGDQRDVGAGLGGGARDREAHLAARAVGEAAHRIDRLEGRPGGDSTRLPASSLGWKKAISSSSSSAGSSIRPSPISPQAWSPLPGPSTVAPSARELGEVALRRRMRPHLAVHRRRDQQRAALDRPRQAEQRQQVVGAAVQQLGDEVGARRRDQHGVGLARQVDVRHVVGVARVPLAGVDGAVRERLQRHRGDELLGRLGHHDLHRRAGLDQRARQLGRLVAGDAARQAEHDVAARELGGRWRCGGIHGPGLSTSPGAPRSRARRSGLARGHAADRAAPLADAAHPVELADDDRAPACRRGRSARWSGRRAASSRRSRRRRDRAGSCALNGVRSRKLADHLGAPPCS